VIVSGVVDGATVEAAALFDHLVFGDVVEGDELRAPSAVHHLIEALVPALAVMPLPMSR
jgi:hypothetical protein